MTVDNCKSFTSHPR